MLRVDHGDEIVSGDYRRTGQPVGLDVVGRVKEVQREAFGEGRQSVLLFQGKGRNVHRYQMEIGMASQVLHGIACVEETGVVKDDEIRVRRNLRHLVDQVVGIAPDAWEVILDVPSINADSNHPSTSAMISIE
jgi:hypothetical protein